MVDKGRAVYEKSRETAVRRALRKKFYHVNGGRRVSQMATIGNREDALTMLAELYRKCLSGQWRIENFSSETSMGRRGLTFTFHVAPPSEAVLQAERDRNSPGVFDNDDYTLDAATGQVWKNPPGTRKPKAEPEVVKSSAPAGASAAREIIFDD